MRIKSNTFIDLINAIKKCLNLTLFLFIIFMFCYCFNSSANDENNAINTDNPKQVTGSDTQNSTIPTVITSNSMDMDMKKKLIILSGDVVVEEPTTTIYCDKAYVYLKKDNESQKSSAQVKKQNSGGLDSAGDQKVDKVIGVGHVVIIKKQHKDEDGKIKPVQKAVGGKAVYDANLGTIVLTKEPKLIQGESYVSGTRIIFWKDSDRLKVEGSQSTGAQRSRLIFTPNDEAQMNNSGT